MSVAMVLGVFFLFIAPYLIFFLVTFIGSLNIHVAGWISDLFWNLLGEQQMFKIIANVLQTALSMDYTPAEFVIKTAVEVVTGALLDAIVIATCIYLIKSVCAMFSQSGALWYSFGGKKILAKYVSIAGIVLGVFVINIFKNQRDQIRDLINAGISIGCIFVGVVIMLGKARIIPNAKKRDRLISNLLIDILIDMSLAISTAVIATCSMEGPRLIFIEGNLKLLYCYLAVEAVILSVSWGIAMLAAWLKKL